MEEFNTLGIPDMPTITTLCQLSGAYVNLEYTLPNGEKMRLGNRRYRPKKKGRKKHRGKGVILAILAVLIAAVAIFTGSAIYNAPTRQLAK